jgi:HSP20 family protein
MEATAMLTLWKRLPNGGNAALLPALSEELDNLFNDFAIPSFGWSNPSLFGAADVTETEDAVRMAMDMPGHDPQSIQIQAMGNTLTIRAERKTQQEGKRLRAERIHGTFSRSFTLPAGVDASRAEASYENGVLVLTLPKREEAKPRTIEVKVK